MNNENSKTKASTEQQIQSEVYEANASRSKNETQRRGGMNMRINIRIEAIHEIDITDLMDTTLRDYIEENISHIIYHGDIDVEED
tara:strand:+ start:239 stop:493 length:255 start_codon:yes stop_codon:yes gene_type:complete